MVIAIDSSVLSAYYGARAGMAQANLLTSGSGAKPRTPRPPGRQSRRRRSSPSWCTRSWPVGKFIDPSPKLDVASSSDDYRKLFGLYQGLVALQGLADQIGAKGVGETEKARMRTRFAEGMKEVGAFLDTTNFETVRDRPRAWSPPRRRARRG